MITDKRNNLAAFKQRFIAEARHLAPGVLSVGTPFFLNSMAILFAVAFFLLFLFYKELRFSARLKSGVMALLLVGIVLASLIFKYEAKYEAGEAARAEQRQRAELAEKVRLAQQAAENAFKNMSPTEHLKAAEGLLRPDAAKPALDEARKHLGAIPLASPEHPSSEELSLLIDRREKEERRVIDQGRINLNPARCGR